MCPYFDPAKIVWGHRDLLFPTSSRHFDYLSLYAFDRIHETDLIGKYARHAKRSGRAVSPSIITISRQFGSGVRQIGAESVDRLNIPFSASPRISLNGRRTGRIGFSPLCIKQAPGAGLCHWMTKSIRLRSGRSKSWRARTPSWAGREPCFGGTRRSAESLHLHGPEHSTEAGGGGLRCPCGTGGKAAGFRR